MAQVGEVGGENGRGDNGGGSHCEDRGRMKGEGMGGDGRMGKRRGGRNSSKKKKELRIKEMIND